MRPLARVHAVTDGTVLQLADLGVRAAAIAASGSAVALHARDRAGTAELLAQAAVRFVSLCRPSQAQVFVSGRPDIARAAGAQGVQLAASDLTPADARLVLGDGLVGRSVHSAEEAVSARDEGADFVLLGPVFPTLTHPGQEPLGLEAVNRAARSGVTTVAIGGITAENAGAVKDAGAWGVAAIRALWLAEDPAAATRALLAPWTEDDQ